MTAIGWISSFLIFLSLSAHGACDPSSSKLNQAGKSYFERDQYLLASVQFKLASILSCDRDSQQTGLFNYMLSMNKLGEKTEVLTSLEEIGTPASPKLQEKLNLFKAIEMDNSGSLRLTEDQKLRIDKWNNRYFEPANRKSPALAGTMSALLPGAGQAYVGAWQSAAYSFIINSLFLASALELNRQGLQTTSLAAGAVFSITYVGGIISAAQTAKLYNENQTRQMEIDLHRATFPELYP